MIGWNPRCYRPSFIEIKYLDPEKNNFEGCLPYMGETAEHLTQIPRTKVHFPYLRRLDTNLAF